MKQEMSLINSGRVSALLTLHAVAQSVTYGSGACRPACPVARRSESAAAAPLPVPATEQRGRPEPVAGT